MSTKHTVRVTQDQMEAAYYDIFGETINEANVSEEEAESRRKEASFAAASKLIVRKHRMHNKTGKGSITEADREKAFAEKLERLLPTFFRKNPQFLKKGAKWE